MTTFTDALPPFSRETAAEVGPPDLILRSSDSVDFHTHKTLLGFVSPVFQDMFGFPPPTQLKEGVDVRDAIPIVQLSEPSDALRKLLLLCYPQALTNESLDNLDGLYLAYGAADKYQIPNATTAILAAISSFIKDEPYRVHAIACHFGLPDLGKSAARQTLKDFFLPTDRKYGAPEFALVPASKLLRLHRFHVECGENAAKIVKGYTATLPYDEHATESELPWRVVRGHDANCGAFVDQDNVGSPVYSPAQWFQNHMGAVEEVVRYQPNGDAAAKAVLDYGETLRDISKCQLCSRDSARHLSVLSDNLREGVERSNDHTALVFTQLGFV
ncbi:hypothetical protein FB45DRAFT_892145 [Roridomyces roridus]|uniref:BTB domain-containing protein n=1 Tax=Roridomyces roridus TaxID=1738132 RepID=A0AAD7G079_9AGAR|nr:hypothetical protein FB45DRAFT_892145 [Roridomyces roridus]